MSIPNSSILAGQVVDVRIVLATQKNAVLVPNEGTKSAEGGHSFTGQARRPADLRLGRDLGQRQEKNVVVTQGSRRRAENVMVTGKWTVAPGGESTRRYRSGPRPGGAPAGCRKARSEENEAA